LSNYNRMKILERMKYDMKRNRKKIFETFVLIICPFVIPILMGLDYVQQSIAKPMYYIVYISLIGLNVFGIIWLQIKNKQTADDLWTNKASRYAYSNLYDLNETKRLYHIDRSYKPQSIPAEFIPYDVHRYIGEVCKSFSETIRSIADIKKENMSVSFIYRYVYDKCDDKEWKWITGRELTLTTPLSDFINQKDTVYYQLLNSKETVFFCNDKKEWIDNGKYYVSARDCRHNKTGSFFVARIMFSNNAKSFCEGIIMVSSYGKKFVEEEDNYSVDEMKRLIIDNIFPCYQRLLETELGMLYFRHKKDD